MVKKVKNLVKKMGNLYIEGIALMYEPYIKYNICPSF